jgi:hypothetical protein
MRIEFSTAHWALDAFHWYLIGSCGISWISVGNEFVKTRRVEGVLALTVYHRLRTVHDLFETDCSGAIPANGRSLSIDVVVNNWNRHASWLLVWADGNFER